MDNSFDNLADASELGFFDFKQPFNKLSTPKGEKDICFEPKQELSKSHPKEQTPQAHKVSEALSPALFFQTGVDFTTSGDFNGGSKDNGHKGQDDPFGFSSLKNIIQKQEYIEPYNEEPLNLIWSNEPLLKTPKANPTSSPTNRSKVKKEDFEGASSKNFEHFDRFMGDNEEYFNFESMDQSRTEKDASRYFGNRRDDSEMFLAETIGFDKASSSKLPGTDKFPPLVKKNTWEGPSRKRSDSFHDDDPFDPNSEKGRSSRGLRALSLKVKDIVSEKKRTSYKEVAECLIDELGQKMKGKLQGESKDEQNVKRRVYDALNVLIAADILKKDGKAVYCDDKVANIGAHRRRSMREDKEKLEIKMFDAKKRRKVKGEALQELVYKCLAIKNLIKRNKENQEGQVVKKLDLEAELEVHANQDVNNENNRAAGNLNATKIGVEKNHPSFKDSREDQIPFPFIILEHTAVNNSMNLNMNPAKNKVIISSSNPFYLFGDIDILQKMNLHHAPKDFYREIIPQNVDQFLPKSFLDSLK